MTQVTRMSNAVRGVVLSFLVCLIGGALLGNACAARQRTVTLTVEDLRLLEECVVSAVSDEEKGIVEAQNCIESLLPPEVK